MGLFAGGWLLYAAWPKLLYPLTFLDAIYGYAWVDARTGWWTASLLPAAELVVGCCLFVGLFRGAAWIAAVVMGCVFVAAQAHAVRHGLDIACGCFGNSTAGAGETVGRRSVLTSLGFTLLAVAGLALWWFSPRNAWSRT